MRKVVGASTAAIIVLLSRRVLALVAIGAVLASILSYAVMDRWLAAFAYRVEAAPGTFALAAVLALAVAFVTVALQSFGVARASFARRTPCVRNSGGRI